MPFETLIGQPQVVELLTRAIACDRIAPAYLFAGAPGVGRSLAAKSWIAHLLSADPHGTPSLTLRQRIQQGNHPDLLWVEPTYLHQNRRISAVEAVELGVKRRAPPQIRLEQIREIAQFLARPPLEARRAVVVVEDAETMAEPAANGLLKTLEEPGTATVILIAPSVESLLPTLVSRCQRISFRRLSTREMAQVLEQTGHTEILQHPEVLALAEGSPGEAIAHWQQLQAIAPELLEKLRRSPHSLRDALQRARQIHEALDAEAQLWLVDYLQHAYWQQGIPVKVLHHLETARRQLRSYVQPRLVWEVLWMRMVEGG